jgi:hypothetical protein
VILFADGYQAQTMTPQREAQKGRFPVGRVFENLPRVRKTDIVESPS